MESDFEPVIVTELPQEELADTKLVLMSGMLVGLQPRLRLVGLVLNVTQQ